MQLVIVGDEAYTVEEWEALQRERDAKRTRYATDPAYRAAKLAAWKRWREAHREAYRTYKREWKRMDTERKRASG